MTATSWLIGSFELAANATITVNGAPVVIGAGAYYLRDASPALSLIDTVQAAIAGSTITIGRNRKVRITFAGGTTIAIPVALRAALGFTQPSYGPSLIIIAESVSRLLWSPGWPEKPRHSPVVAEGRKHWDRVMTSSPTGETVDVTLHHSMTLADWSWSAVRPDRAWTAAAAPGEYVDFFERIIVFGHPFKLYPQIEESDSSATAVTWTTPFGPYVVPDPDYDWYTRFSPNTDAVGANIEIAAMKTSELL